MRRPLRPCRKSGCGALTREGYCEVHGAYREQRELWHKLYNTQLWREYLRPGQLIAEPFCRVCARAGRRVRATVVDHILPHRGDMARFRDVGNLQSLCKRCHDAKTMRENNLG